MKRFIVILFTLSLFGCASETPKRVYEEVIEITEVNPNRLTALTKQNLFHLAKVYDLRPFLFTKKIFIQSYVIPHSHPDLTLNTRNAERPDHLLATWLHEEFHWWAAINQAASENAVKDFKKKYPMIPKEAGTNARSAYFHFIVCFNEYKALIHFLGKNAARSIIDELIMKDKIYPWIYSQILKDEQEIGKILRKHRLIAPPLT